LVQGVVAKTVAAESRRRLETPIDSDIAGSDRLRQKRADVLAGARYIAVSGLRLGYLGGGSILMPPLLPAYTGGGTLGQSGAARPIDERAVGRLKVRHHGVVTVGHDPTVHA